MFRRLSVWKTAWDTTSRSNLANYECNLCKLSTLLKPPEAVVWDEEYVARKKPGRRPKMKPKTPHQWWYNNPNYDPMIKYPKYFISPHAPAHLFNFNYWKLYHKYKPKVGGNRYRRKFIHWLQLRVDDWEQFYKKERTEKMMREKLEASREKEIERQRAWRDYRLMLFEKAISS